MAGRWRASSGVSAIVLDRRKPPSRVLFNNAQWVLMGLAGGLIYETMGGASWQDLPPRASRRAAAPIVVSIAAVIAVNAGLMLGILALQEQIKPSTIWRNMVLTSVGPYFAYGLLGLLMAVLWSIGGGFAAALVLLPLLVARRAFNQYAEQREAYESTIRALVQAVETKDHYTRGHSERVSRASVLIARVLDMREDRVEALRYAGILHDVGKLGVPTRVLQKTGPLERHGVRRDQAPPQERHRDGSRHRLPRRGLQRDHASPRAARRSRLSAGPRRKRHPRVRQDHRGRRCVRLDDLDAFLPGSPRRARGARASSRTVPEPSSTTPWCRR